MRVCCALPSPPGSLPGLFQPSRGFSARSCIAQTGPFLCLSMPKIFLWKPPKNSIFLLFQGSNLTMLRLQFSSWLFLAPVGIGFAPAGPLRGGFQLDALSQPRCARPGKAKLCCGPQNAGQGRGWGAQGRLSPEATKAGRWQGPGGCRGRRGNAPLFCKLAFATGMQRSLGKAGMLFVYLFIYGPISGSICIKPWGEKKKKVSSPN